MATGSTSAATLFGKLRGLFARAGEPHGRRDCKPAGPGGPADWKARAAHAGVGFLVVLAAYWFYAAAIVRLIEPTFEHRDTDKLTAGDAEGARRRISRELAEIGPFFGPGSWELENPKILQSDSLKLLMGGYRNLGDGRVRIQPCTMIFLPHGDDPDPQRQAHNAVILQAPEGALLRFDQPLNLRRMKVGRLIAGTLEGQIVIRSAGRQPGPEDDLWITTRDVQLTERSIWTAEPVFFRWGPHYGRGRELRISLIPGPQAGDSKSHGPSIAGAESFELAHVERLHLELGRKTGARPAAQGPIGLLPRAAAGASPAVNPGQAPGAGQAADAEQAANPEQPATLDSWTEAPIPVELSCRGPFRFDVARKVATFEDCVNVWRINPTGPSDQLECDRLSIFFEEQGPSSAANEPSVSPTSPAPAAQQAASSGSSPGRVQRLVPRRIEAHGNPVVLAMPSQQAAARGERLEYDFVERRIVLDSTEQVWLSQRNSEIHARSLQYQFADAGRLGRVVASGAGWLRAQMDEKPEQVLEARWMDRLLVRPHEQNQLISLTGGAQVKFQGIGRMAAQEVHLWLTEQPAASPQGLPRLEPDRLLARDNVRIDSAQLSGRVEQLEVWFESAAPAAQTQLVGATPEIELLPAAEPSARLVPVGSGASARAWLTSSPPGISHSPSGAAHSPPGTSHHCLRVPPAVHNGPFRPAGRLVAVSPAGGAAATPAAAPGLARCGAPEPVRHFEITGRLLQARIRYGADQRTELAEVTVEDNVQLCQAPTWESEELRVSGRRLHALGPQRPDGEVTVTGQPARLSAKGLELVGPNIYLNRGTNRMWIEGAGQMQFPLNRQLDGRLLEPPGVMAVEWQDGMVFDGQAARFETAVVAQTLIAQAWRQRLWTETLEVRLARRLDFADPQHQPRPEPQQVFCRGGVSMESRDFDARGQISHERFEAADLAINLQSGALTAGGPGWLNSVRPGSQDAPWNVGGRSTLRDGSTPAGTSSREPAPSAGSPGTRTENAEAGLKCLHVRFQDSVQGDVHNRHLTFLGQVSASYTPALSWVALPEVDEPDRIGSDGVSLRCQRLSVWQMADPLDGRRTFEVEALGNPVVEGRTFTARAIRMSYAEGKDLLVLEGDGRTDAELYYQARIGGATSQAAARRIFFWPRSNRLKVDGARSLELTGFSLGRAGP